MLSLNKYGLTLTELIVSSILIAIIMLGITSFSITTKQIQESTYKATILSTKAAALMNMLKKDAVAAIGDKRDSGVRTHQGADGHSICFRHDVASSPSTYSDDIWVCYYQDTNFTIMRCYGTSSANVPPSSSAQCESGATQIMKDLVTLSSLGLFNVPGGCGACNAPGDVNNMTYVEFSIAQRYDNTKAYHPITNPQYTLKAQVNPSVHSR